MRDPRADPRPGDVLRNGSETRSVRARDSAYNGFVTYHNGKMTWRCRISTWKRAMRDAEVLHVAGEGER